MDWVCECLYFSDMNATSPGPLSSRSSPVPAFFLYGEPVRAADDETVHVETIAARSRLHDWTIGAHRHRDLHQVLVIRRGRVRVRLDDADADLRAPGLVIVPPGSVHAFAFEANTEGVVVSFAGELGRDLVAHADGAYAYLARPAVGMPPRDAVRATDLDRLCDMLLREFGRSAPGRDATLRGLLGALLGNVGRLVGDSAAPAVMAPPRDRELVARFREAIERHYREHWPLAAYARVLEVSEARLRRACQAAVGEAPTDLVQWRLMVEAKRQLRFTTMTAAQIAYHLGFEDPAYFTRFFTRLAGHPPSAFRRRDSLR